LFGPIEETKVTVSSLARLQAIVSNMRLFQDSLEVDKAEKGQLGTWRVFSRWNKALEVCRLLTMWRIRVAYCSLTRIAECSSQAW